MKKYEEKYKVGEEFVVEHSITMASGAMKFYTVPKGSTGIILEIKGSHYLVKLENGDMTYIIQHALDESTSRQAENDSKDGGKGIRVEVLINDTSMPKIYENVVNTFQEGNLFCVQMDKTIDKFPIASIYRIREFI